MDNPCRINNNKKKTPKQKPSTKTENISKSLPNKKSKNNIRKGGIISDIHTLTGKELIDQAILENKPEYNTKLITIARIMIDNK